MNSSPDAVVVGAGLAGLAAARRLHAAGRSVVVLESDAAVGGRVRTDVVEGFRLDRGFQVLLTAYPEARSVLDYAALELRKFAPGALVAVDGVLRRVDDPWRNPLAFLTQAFTPVGTLFDKLKLARLRADVRRGGPYDALSRPERPTIDLLRSRGFSPSMIERFFRPFFGGILLDPSLRSSSAMTEFVFRMFSEGDGAVPRDGMGRIPEQMAAALPAGAVRLGVKVDAVDDGRVTFVDAQGAKGELRPRGVIVAAPTAELVRTEKSVRGWRSVVNVCVAGEGPAPVAEPRLVLDGDGGAAGPAANLAFLSQVSRGYAPEGAHLASWSILGDAGAAASDADLFAAVKRQGATWFGDAAVRSWRPLRVYRIRRALPRQNPPWYGSATWPTRVRRGVHVAGDDRDTASIDGALRAGRFAAEGLLADFDG